MPFKSGNIDSAGVLFESVPSPRVLVTDVLISSTEQAFYISPEIGPGVSIEVDDGGCVLVL